MRARIGLAAVLAGLALPAAAPAYPPITCGRMTVSGTTYIVRTHGPTCAFAERWIRAYLVHRSHPSSYRCRAYGDQTPAYCKNTRYRYRFRYFFANPAS